MSLTWVSVILLVGMVLCNWAVEHNVGMFSAFPLLYACGKGHAVASTMNNSANLMSSC